MEADGSNIKRITDSKRHYIDPQWSPDGSKILFWSQHNNVTKSDIGFINMSDRRIVELMYTENNDLFATWSPDGQKIVFISDRDDTDGSNDIYIMNIDGTNQVKLINGVKAFYPPRFSPDGSKIAFCSVAGYDQYKIFLSDANGTNIRQITPSNKFSDVLFDWSLEGNQIIFSAVTRRSNLADLTDIYLINVDGTNLTRLTSGSGQDLAPSWLKTGLNRTPTSVSKQTPAAIPASVPPTCIPLLISPMAGAILDNGRVDSNDYIRWDFKWTDCPGSTAYHLYVIGPNAQNPVIDNSSIITSYYPYGSRGYVVERYRFGWTWKVRAKLNGQWSNWSETRSFDVGPLRNTPP